MSESLCPVCGSECLLYFGCGDDLEQLHRTAVELQEQIDGLDDFHDRIIKSQRREIERLKDEIKSLSIPPCQNCGENRYAITSYYCNNCDMEERKFDNPELDGDYALVQHIEHEKIYGKPPKYCQCPRCRGKQ